MTGCGEAPDPPTPILRQVDRHRQRRAEARRRGACERGLGGTDRDPSASGAETHTTTRIP